jgi:hypothetical protein
MSLTIKVNGTDNSLAHKGSNHIAKNTPPDVCKTPSPGGPVPIPYPVIISMSSDLAKGTTTVKVDGGNMAAIKGSEFSRCSGDEAGTAGGVVSSTNMKEATWITYSMNVKMDGKNACRLTDKMKMNHGNTVCMMGLKGKPVEPEGPTKKECQTAIKLLTDFPGRIKQKYSKNPNQGRAVIAKLQALGGSITSAHIPWADEVFPASLKNMTLDQIRATCA